LSGIVYCISADNTKRLKLISSSQDSLKLQEDLNKLNFWSTLYLASQRLFCCPLKEIMIMIREKACIACIPDQCSNHAKINFKSIKYLSNNDLKVLIEEVFTT